MFKIGNFLGIRAFSMKLDIYVLFTIFNRLFKDNILCVGSEIGRLPPQFGDAAKIASAILNSGFEYDAGRLFYNEYK